MLQKLVLLLAMCLLASCGGNSQRAQAIRLADAEIEKLFLHVGDSYYISCPPLYYQYKGLKYTGISDEEISELDKANGLEYKAVLSYGSDASRIAQKSFDPSQESKWRNWSDSSPDDFKILVTCIKGEWSINSGNVIGEIPSQEDLRSIKEP